MPNCPFCGHNTPDAAFCAHCGQRLGDAGSPSGALAPQDLTVLVGHAAADTRLPQSGSTPAVMPFDGVGQASRSLEPGQAFGSRYHLIKVLGIGGMGAVYQAWDQELNVAVALKTIRVDTALDPAGAEDLERRFKRELLLARQVTHKNVVRIHDLGEMDGIKYITMPFIDGADLRQVLEKAGRLPIASALTLMRQVVDGVQAAHEAGIVHRDLKPANVMVDGDRAIVMDFGIARAAPGATIAATMAGAVTGTIEYMAPEQARGEEVDARADVYALGLMLYDLVLGVRGASGSTSAFADLMARMQKPPRAPREIDPSIPEALERIIMRCLAPDRSARYESAAALAADLAALDDWGQPRATARRRSRHVMWAAAAGFAIVLTGAATWGVIVPRLRPAATAAEHAPVSVLIADFRNETGDPVFEGTLEPLLTLHLESAPFITSYSRSGAKRLLQQIAPERASLDAAAAQLVSKREGISLVLSGAVAFDGRRYRVSVNSVNAADGTVAAEAAASASSKQEVLTALTAVAADLRKALGDTAPRQSMLNETFTAASIEAAHAYSKAQGLALAGSNEEAIQHYREAVQLDPSFGRAYSGWAISAARLGRQQEAADMWKKALGLLDRMSPRERYRTLGGYYMNVSRNYEQAIENYRMLVRLYPSDGAGLNSLGVAYFSTLDFRGALEQGREALRVYPKNALYRTNYALYAMYAGDFTTAAEQAATVIRENSTLPKAYLVLAMASLAQGNAAAASSEYERMKGTGPAGASLANTGLADLASAAGQFVEAERLLRLGITQDEAGGSTAAAAIKHLALAEVLQAQGRTPAAIEEVERGLTRDPEESIAVQAARVLVAGGRFAEAHRLATDLGGRLQKRSRAYGKLIEGEIALARGPHAAALDAFGAARQLADLWLVQEALGRTYLAAGQPAEAFGALDACEKRLGEATAVFLDDVPTFRVIAAMRKALAAAKSGVGRVTTDAGTSPR